MRNICLLLFISLLPFTVSAQNVIKVSESSESIAGGQHNALSVNILQADKSDIEREWKNLMRKYDAKVRRVREIFADDAEISEISENTIDVYAYVDDRNEDEPVLIVAFDMGGDFLNSSKHAREFQQAKEILYEFGLEMTKDAIKEELKGAEKDLKQQDRELTRLIRDKERLQDDIENYKQKITDAENDIITNEQDQEKKKQDIELQKQLILEIEEKLKSVR